jgi:hypothetical protein
VDTGQLQLVRGNPGALGGIANLLDVGIVDDPACKVIGTIVLLGVLVLQVLQ